MAAAAVLPRTVAYLGEVTNLVVYVPGDQYYEPPYRSGRVLFASPSGREMFVLRPRVHGQVLRQNTRALRALDLHSRFMHREADGYYNCLVPHAQEPHPIGELAIIHYVADKTDDGRREEVEYVHYFEGDVAPAFPPVYDLGSGQLWIARGRWRVDEAGIEFYDPSQRKEDDPWRW